MSKKIAVKAVAAKKAAVKTAAAKRPIASAARAKPASARFVVKSGSVKLNAAKTARKTAVKSAIKRAAKPTVKAVVKKIAARQMAKPVAKVAPKPALEPALKSASRPAAAPVLMSKEKIKKPKLVRDSFTMPEAEHRVLIDVKRAFLKSGVLVKKSELLRAGVALIKAMDQARLHALIVSLPAIKAGRPKSDK